MPILESVLAEEPANAGLHSGDEETLLVIGANPEDHAALQRIVTELDWRVSTATTRWGALNRLASEHIAAIFCDEVLEDGTWKDILNQIGAGGSAPPIIVTSRLADAFLWSEVLNLGGYDVLLKPFSTLDVTHVLRNISLRKASRRVQGRVAGAA